MTGQDKTRQDLDLSFIEYTSFTCVYAGSYLYFQQQEQKQKKSKTKQRMKKRLVVPFNAPGMPKSCGEEEKEEDRDKERHPAAVHIALCQ